MKTVLGLFILLLLSGCSSRTRQDPIKEIDKEIKAGNFSSASERIDALIQEGRLNESQQYALLFTRDSLHRVKLDFNRTKDEIIAWIEKNHLFTPSDSLFEVWEKSKSLEFRIIDGEKRYFRNAAPNIFRVDASVRELSGATPPSTDVPRDALLIDAFANKIKTDTKGKYLLPGKTMKARFTLTVNADAVPEGEILKVWLPFPRKDNHRQSDVKLLSASQPDYIFSDDQTAHASLYMEQKAVEGEPAVFRVDFEFSIFNGEKWNPANGTSISTNGDIKWN